MSKYDAEVDLSETTSTGLILRKINPGAKILEFGCATGRMTRYMKEVLRCQVYIVEYDKDAFESAIQYAEDGICDDIMKFVWLEEFRDIQFDAIIFADVLEHLVKPEEALCNAAKLLKNDGIIYVSVPNITHNDILIKGYYNYFDYTKLGLLDDTHVHFWGLNNLEQLANNCDLRLRSVEATYCPTGETEQFEGSKISFSAEMFNLLRERLCGEIYQFIITLDKNKEIGNVKEYNLKRPSINSSIYINTGKGFNEQERINVRAQYSDSGSYVVHYVIDDVSNIRQIRFDPVEFQGCILRHISIRQGDEKLRITYSEHFELAESILILETDPKIFVEPLNQDEEIVIDAEILLMGERYVTVLQKEYQAKFLRLKEEKMLETQKLREQLVRLVDKNQKFHQDIIRLEKEKQEFEKDLGAYIILCNRKDECLIDRDKELQYYQKLTIIRCWNFIRYIYDKLKKYLKSRGI